MPDTGESKPDATTPRANGLQMSREAMLELAQRAAELLVEWNEQLPAMDAWDGEFREALASVASEEPPENGQPALDVLERAVQKILPTTARLGHPRSFAFVPSSPTWPGVLADFLASGYNVNACTWLVASGPSEVELAVVDWFRRWLGYPEGAGGLFTSGGAAAALDALVAAREAAANPQRASVYMSDQTHSVVPRAARIIGIPGERIHFVRSDSEYRLDVSALAETVARDRAAGVHPLAVCANAGTASTGAVDPLPAIAEFCEAEGLWLHVDAAYGGFAVLTDQGKMLLRGIERADSIGLDAHKWFYQPYEAGCLLVKDVRTLEHAFGLHHDVLQDTVWGAGHPNFADRGLQLSRAFRALKVWMSVQTFGLAAFREAVSGTMDLAARAGRYIDARPTLELLAPVSLGIVCFRVNPDRAGLDETALEKLNRAVLARVFWDDRALVSSTTLVETFSLRLCILNHNTTWDDVRETLDAVERFGAEPRLDASG